MSDSNLQTRIIGVMADDPEGAFTTAALAASVLAHREHVQEALHTLDDNGAVILRNGFYRLSEATKRNLK